MKTKSPPSPVNAGSASKSAFCPPTQTAFFRPYKFEDASSIDPRKLEYGSTMQLGQLTMTIAPGGMGKSALLLTDAVAIATGRNLVGTEPKAPTKVALWNGEDPVEELQRRVAGTVKYYDLDTALLGENLFLNSGRVDPLTLVTPSKSGPAVVTAVYDKIVTGLIGNGIKVLILDPFISIHTVSENDNVAIDTVAKALGKIAHDADCAIHVVHHSRKTGGDEVGSEHGRGAISLVSAAREVRVINPMSKADATKLSVEKRDDVIRVDVGKENNSRTKGSRFYQIVPVELGNGNARYDGDVVGVIVNYDPGSELPIMSEDELKVAVDAIASGEWRQDPQASAWVGKALAALFNLDDKKDRGRIVAMIDFAIRTGAFSVLERKDAKGQLRKYVVPAR